MKKTRLSIFLIFFSLSILKAQKNIKGIVKAATTEMNLEGVLILIKEANQKTSTNVNGLFLLKGLSSGKYILILEKKGYRKQKIPITIHKNSIDLNTFYLEEEILEEDFNSIIITDEELDNEDALADNLSGLLQFSRDVYSRTVAFDWSSSFYKVRGLNSENGKVLMNGVEMNKMFNGRPQWSNWGGLNDVLRNQEFSNGLATSNNTFGGVLGVTNITTRASEYKPQTKVSYASSNRSYRHRVMASYASGILKNDWSFVASGSFRYGEEGFNDGTSYEAYSLFTSIEKKINEKHSLNFTGIFAPNKRGKSSPNTQEVYDLKGTKYNEYWGWLNGKKINARAKEVIEPLFMLNHYWDINSKTTLNTNVSYQFGSIGNSRLDYTFATNPSPSYYQNLPSSYIENLDFIGAYESQEEFKNNGQLDWERIYDANLTNNETNTIAAYILYEDRNDDKQYNANSILSFDYNDHITLNAKLEYKKLETHNYAKVTNLLGSTIGYLDFDRYGDTPNAQQNDLQNPNRIVGVDDTFKYNYLLNASVLNSFVQGQFNYKKYDFFLASEVNQTNSQREGLYENGSYRGTLSFGKSEKVNFVNFGVKSGCTYKITGRHLVSLHAGFISKAPNLKNTFFNARENNDIVENLKSEKIITTDISYTVRTPILTGKVAGYYAQIQDATEIGYFFADGLSGIGEDDNAFVQEILTGIHKLHFGVELGLEAQITSSFKLKGAMNMGQYTYTNNPNLKLTSDAFNTLDLGEANLKNYKLASGPQKAFAFGFEYRDPSYWWVGVTTNYLANTYVDVAPLTRTKNFYLDTDGLPFNDYDLEVAKELLQQERFDDYVTVNAIGGKSWKIEDYYLGLFIGINNLFDATYKTGGFEQGRNANYRSLRDDNLNDVKIFGSKYWYGRGTTYFAMINLRF